MRHFLPRALVLPALALIASIAVLPVSAQTPDQTGGSTVVVPTGVIVSGNSGVVVPTVAVSGVPISSSIVIPTTSVIASGNSSAVLVGQYSPISSGVVSNVLGALTRLPQIITTANYMIPGRWCAYKPGGTIYVPNDQPPPTNVDCSKSTTVSPWAQERGASTAGPQAAAAAAAPAGSSTLTPGSPGSTAASATPAPSGAARPTPTPSAGGSSSGGSSSGGGASSGSAYP